MQRHLLASALAAVTVASGCAATAPHARTTAVAQARAVDPGGADASGTWDWMFRSTDDQGDMRVEQEEWHLAQKGAHIEGYYDRAVTMMSVDERLFRCNQRLGFTKTTRVRVAGNIEGDRIVLREVAFDAKPGPCDDGARNLVAYIGVLHGATLALRWGPEAGQTLVRRTDSAGHTPLAGNDVGGNVQPASMQSQEPSAPVAGTWVWELRSIDAEGDERTEREEWHLTENPDGVSGYYDRTVARVRGDGTNFVCNGQPRYETTTRYNVSGQRFGDKLSLTETDYKAARSPCDNALRRLDTYQGHVADADSLILSWGPGNQLLRRKKQ
ncbi:MAG TPA: hypothetical protein VN947_34185 [Polyangia bacterium]|nr:hypothetical protein [Polyangia bacterium]